MPAELHRALDEAEADAQVRAIILTGAGRGFSAGYDIARRPDGRAPLDGAGVEHADFIKDWWTRDAVSTQRLLHLWHLSKPIIAAVHGWVMGGGFWYSLAADITIAAGMLMTVPLSAMAHASYNVERGDLLEAMKAGGLKAFLEARDGAFRPEPFGPKAERPRS